MKLVPSIIELSFKKTKGLSYFEIWVPVCKRSDTNNLSCTERYMAHKSTSKVPIQVKFKDKMMKILMKYNYHEHKD